MMTSLAIILAETVGSKPWIEIWAPPIVSALGSIAGSWILISRGLKNLLEAQQDKHIKDRQREAEAAWRQREERRLLVLIEEYSRYFYISRRALVIFRLMCEQKGKVPAKDAERVSGPEAEESNRLYHRMKFVDPNTDRHELLKCTKPTITMPSQGWPDSASFDVFIKNHDAAESAVRSSLHQELARLKALSD